MKSTKTNKGREVPLLPETRKLLLDYAKNNPAGYEPKSFIFFQVNNPGRPVRQETLNTNLSRALVKIGIDREEKKARGLCFHSWRHYFSKKMAAILNERAMKLTGHSSKAVFEEYANHADEKDFQKAAQATTEVFGRILEFKNNTKEAI